MRLFAIGDIHGCRTALQTLLNTLDLRPNDRIITLGDYIDRGIDSKGVLDLLLHLHRSDQLIPLRGNHEEMMLAAREDRSSERFWRHCGGEEALMSYSKRLNPTLNDIPSAHWYFVEHVCLDWYESEKHFFVHAGVDPKVPLEDQTWQDLHWRFLDTAARHCSGKTMVCGHSEQRSGIPKDLGFALCIDTWAYGGQWLTCWEVGSQEFRQANEKGESRIIPYALAVPEARR